MANTLTTVPLYPQAEFPEDPGLSELSKLFDAEWVCRTYQQRFGGDDLVPCRFRIRQFSHTLGRTAIVSYAAEWGPDDYLPARHFAARIERGRPVELFEFPDDPSLPGLKEAAHPEGALNLVNRHVLSMRARVARVEVVRYRPGNRAVLRHSVGKMRLYARVMQPNALPAFLDSWEPVARSSFAAPRIAGCWPDGGVVWMSEIPGKNLRRHIRRGNQPDPGLLLGGLESLWGVPDDAVRGRPFNLSGAYHRAKRSFIHMVRDNDMAALRLSEASEELDPFVESWMPSGIAHNDFYDDQMLVLPDNRMALVDFEEVGPGDPMLDAGNFLAHLRWGARFGSQRQAGASGAYYDIFRAAALDRFRWSERDLNLREAVCLFRICTNAVRHPQQDWRQKLEDGLSLVNETLG